MKASAWSTGIARVSGSSMMSVFSALKPGRKPTTIPSRMPGQMIHHRLSCAVKSWPRSSHVIALSHQADDEVFDRPLRQSRVERHREEKRGDQRDAERDSEDAL